MTTTVPDRAGTGGDSELSAGAAGTTGSGRALAWLLVVCGALGVLASFMITLDKIRVLEDPEFQPACSINPVLSCSSVMSSDQASFFGVPHSLTGMITFAMVVALGAGLLAGARYGRWLWWGLNIGSLGGAIFAMWLMTQALYVIGALCLWCTLSWAVTIAIFWYSTMHSLKHGLLPAPRRLVIGLLEFHWAVPVTWCLGIVLLIGIRFWFYWQTLL